MVLRILSVCLILFITKTYTQNLDTNTIDDTSYKKQNEIDDDPNPFAEAAQAFLQGDGKGGPDLAGMMGNFMQSEEGKQLGGMLMGAAINGGGAQLLSGLGSMLNGGKGGFDPAMLGSMLGMLADGPDKKKDDLGSIVNMAGSLFQNSGMNLENGVEMLPQLVSTLNAFMGPEAKQREAQHADHAWLMPPVLERIHILFDHFAHSELGRSLWKVIGAEKFFNQFSRDGRFDFNKFFGMLENQSFRRHWIQLVTKRITDILALVSDPKTHKRYLDTGVGIVNSFMKAQGFPKASIIDLQKPVETITAAVNYFFKKYLDMKINAKQYVQPAIKYVQEVIMLAQQRGLLIKEGLDSRALSQKLTDTLNLEIIEPLARVYRAYRFAKKVPECDKYVLCLINQEDQNEVVSLPGLKTALSKSSSIVVSWFLSGKTGSSFWSLYSNIMDEKDCSIRFVEKCNDFHIEEIKVTTEYVHNEL